MNNENRKFIPYKLLPKRNIIKAAKEIKKINKTNLEDFVIDEFRNYFRNEVQNEPLSFSIKTATLRGISNAVILVHFNKYPLGIYNGFEIDGQARILKKSQNGDVLHLPVIYLTPDKRSTPHERSTTLKHEKIHICQYLQDHAFPLTPDQRDLFLSKTLEDAKEYLLSNADRDAAIDFIINSICYKTWMEVEANYHTEKSMDDFELIKQIYRSSNPILTLHLMIENMNWKVTEMDKAAKTFKAFCNTMQSEIKWVNNLVHSNTSDSLHDLIIKTHHEIVAEAEFSV